MFICALAKNNLLSLLQRDHRGVAPADCWNWGKLGLMEYKWKGSFLGWARRNGTRDFYPALAAIVSSEQYFIFLTGHTMSFYVAPSPSNLVRQSCRVACLLICVSGWLIVFCKADGGGVGEESNPDPDVVVQSLIYSATFLPSVLHIPSKFLIRPFLFSLILRELCFFV